MSSFLSDSTTPPAKSHCVGYLLFYTPDLVPANFFLLPKSENCSQMKTFDDSHDINKNVNAESKAVPSDTFNDCFVQLIETYI